ncbi:MAG: DUF2283 domain-containing protein [Phycisphaerales bacterium]|jgi:uncharacterized protein YuzE
MKVTYDRRTDTLTIELKSGSVATSDDRLEGVILDLSSAGELLSIEILDASTRVDSTSSVELEVAA